MQSIKTCRILRTANIPNTVNNNETGPKSQETDNYINTENFRKNLNAKINNTNS